MIEDHLLYGKVQMLLDYVLILPDDRDHTKTSGGIIYLENEKLNVVRGQVLAIGPGIPFPKDIGIRTPELKVGDNVLFDVNRSDRMRIMDYECCMLSERLVYCKILDDETFDNICGIE